jgi:hypothetical protein
MAVPGVNIVHIVIDEVKHHAGIFGELIELLSEGLQELGATVRQSTNRFDAEQLNVVVGHIAFLQKPVYELIGGSAGRYVIFQTEALDAQAGFAAWFPFYLEFLRQASQVWDYSEKNLQFLAARGCRNGRYVPLGYSRRLERVVHSPVKDIDVFFYGAINVRRRRILDALADRGVRVKAAFGLYGPQRDQYIARSKIVLNLHQFATTQLEQVRISYLLNNRCFVISESAEDNPYRDAVIFADYDKIVDCCISYLRPESDAARARIAETGYANLQAIPFQANIQAAMKLLEDAPRQRGDVGSDQGNG